MILAETIERPQRDSGPAPFQFDEILYSRTDPRGVILAGNEVFGRIAEYPWDKLRGAPHRIIRHPGMPRALFWLLWDRIKRGLPTGAYVKNRTQGGRHYWVFALVTPVEGGYLSVRIKPSSTLFETCQGLYDQALAREAGGLDPEASAAALLGDLRDAGYASYDDFMGPALFREIEARSSALGRTPPKRLALIGDMHSLLHEALQQKQSLLRAFDDIRSIPTNLHIVASRLEVYGGPISTIAENYRLMSAAVTRRLEALTGPDGGTGDSILTSVADGLFLAGAALLFAETRDSCSKGPGFPGVDPAAEAAILAGLECDYQDRAIQRFGGVARAAVQLAASCEDLKRLMLGLDSIRVLCRVEAGRMTSGGEGLQAIITTLDRFHSDVAVKLDRILNLSRRILSVTQSAVNAEN